MLVYGCIFACECYICECVSAHVCVCVCMRRRTGVMAWNTAVNSSKFKVSSDFLCRVLRL